MRLDLGFAVRRHIEVRRVACARRGNTGGRIGYRIVADIVGQVLADEEIVRIVDHLFRCPLSIRTGVDGFEGAEAAVHRPGGVAELVLGAFRREADDVVIVQFRIGGEHAFGIDLLLRVLEQDVPVLVDFVEAAQAEALIGHVIDVVFGDRAVVGSNEIHVGEVSTCLEAGTLGIHRNAVCANSAFRTETGRLFRRQNAADIVDITALRVGVDHAADRELVADRQIDHRFDTVAHLTAIGERGGGAEACIEAVQRWLVGDHADRTGLRAGPEERALRAGEDFHALNIGRVDVEVTARLGQRLFVEIEADIRGKARNASNCQVRRRRSEAADIDCVLAGASAAGGHPRQLDQIVIEAFYAERFEFLFAERRHSNRDALGAFGALGGRHGHGLEALHFRGRLSRCGFLSLRM